MPSNGTEPITPRTVARYGWRRDIPDPRDRIFNLEEPILRASALPASFDVPHMFGNYDQGQLGSCTANGIAAVLEYQAISQGEPQVTPSRLFIYYNERVIEGDVNQDNGAQIRDGIKVVATLGAPPEPEWPYSDANPGPWNEKPPPAVFANAVKREALVYKRIIPGGPGAPIRSAVAAGHPIVFGFIVPDYFQDGSWDPATQALPLPGPHTNFPAAHCVVVTGYDFTRTRFPVNVLKCRNSWGMDWGEHGHFWMDAGWFDPNAGLTDDFWIITQVK